MTYSALYDDRRSAWNARASKQTIHVSLAKREAIAFHYDGSKPINLASKPHSACLSLVRDFQSFHQNSNGWRDIGYQVLICQHGRAIEGCGIENVGAHVAGKNTPWIGVQFMVGVGESPTPEAFARARELVDAINKRAGRSLALRGHKDGNSTSCPGDIIYKWVKAGAKAPSSGGSSTPAPAPAPSPAPSTDALAVDGKLGPKTITRWQQVMGTTADGKISQPSQLVRAVQRYLNAGDWRDARGRKLVVDGLGIRSNNGGDVGPTNTIAALQHCLGTPRDGKFSNPTSRAVRALQVRLNKAKIGSGKF